MCQNERININLIWIADRITFRAAIIENWSEGVERDRDRQRVRARERNEFIWFLSNFSAAVVI